MTQADRPASLKKAPKPAADSSVDPIVVAPDLTPAAASPSAAAPAAASPATQPAPAAKPRREVTVPLSTRVSAQVIETLDAAVASEGITVRAAIEEAIIARWGNRS